MDGRDCSSSAKKVRLDEDINWFDSEEEDIRSEESGEDDACEIENQQSESDSENESETDGDETGSIYGFQRGADLKPKDLHFDESLAGVKCRIPGQISILDYLKLFITSAIMNVIVNETNRYGLQKHRDAWEPVDDKDIWRVFGLVVLMGIVKKPTLKSYWSTRPHLSTSIFGKIISRDRFLTILNCLHFTDNSENPAGNKLFKLGNVLSMICERLSSVLLPGKFISLDESLLAWKGRLSFKQYIPSKRSRFGIKIFALCDAVSGYVHKLSVYIGNEREQAEGTGRGVTHNIVMKLMNGLLNTGRCLYMDNYYNSPELAAELIKNNTHVCGTLRPNRKGVPKDLKLCNGKTIKKGETTSFSNGDCMVGCWRDKKCICLISTMHKNMEVVDTGKVNYKGGKICKPAAILDYNKYMGGVDKSDQNLHYYNAARKTMKWYKKLFFHLLDICVYNAVIVYRVHSGCKITDLEFRNKLIEQIFEYTGSCRKYTSSCASTSSPHRLVLNSPGKNRKPKYRVCKCCSRRNDDGTRKRSETKFRCLACGVSLCESCFIPYHAR